MELVLQNLVVFPSIRGIAIILLEPPAHRELKVKMISYSENLLKVVGGFFFLMGASFFPYEVPQNICRLYGSCKNLLQTLGMGVNLISGGLLTNGQRSRSGHVGLQCSSVLCQWQQVLQYL